MNELKEREWRWVPSYMPIKAFEVEILMTRDSTDEQVEKVKEAIRTMLDRDGLARLIQGNFNHRVDEKTFAQIQVKQSDVMRHP